MARRSDSRDSKEGVGFLGLIEHTEFYPYLLKYLESLALQGFSRNTQIRRETDIRRFVLWCDERSVAHPTQVTKPILERYQRHLYHYRKKSNDEPLSNTTQNQYLLSIKQYFKYLTQENYLLSNPASELKIMRAVKSLPVVLSVDEITQLMQMPDTSEAAGIRERTMLELLYSTGMRRSECCRLQLRDVSLNQSTVFIRKGKGQKDRLIPVGAKAIKWLHTYLDQVRPYLVTSMEEKALFLGDSGQTIHEGSFGSRVKKLMTKAGLDVVGSCHLLRHAMATHMLENGAELRYIQAMLGHGSLLSTERYTHVSIRRLQQVHESTHPSTLVAERVESNEGERTSTPPETSKAEPTAEEPVTSAPSGDG